MYLFATIRIDTNKIDYRYTTADIEGSQTKTRNKFSARAGTTNPLSPKYQVPSYVEDKAPVAKFIKDTLDIHDIPGTTAKITKQRNPESVNKTNGGNQIKNMKASNRNPLNITDIEGATKSKTYVRN